MFMSYCNNILLEQFTACRYLNESRDVAFVISPDNLKERGVRDTQKRQMILS